MPTGFATIGHSNRDLPEFAEMLRDARVDMVADVRSFPRSRSNPVYNIDTLPDDLHKWQIAYRHFPDLGGRRKKQPDVDDNANAMWRVRSFHNYADYALGSDFAAALAELLDLGTRRKVAIMCAEAVWWRCHRRLITDYILARGHPVDHLMAVGRTDPAKMTDGAEVTAAGDVIYPPTKD